MQIISELEGVRRGPYAGAVGYALPGTAPLAVPSSGRVVHPRARLKRPVDTLEGSTEPTSAFDTCIAIRTIVLVDGVARLQAGAGIVADSDPTAEHEECLRKLAAVEAAIELAEAER
jgi:anthranilate synthase component 1